MTNRVILEFIEGLKSYEKESVLVDTFTKGYCYYFAIILKDRFPQGEIWYLPVVNHFVYKIEDRFYDATGDCTETYALDLVYSWSEYQMMDAQHSYRIIMDCIKKCS